MVTAAGFRLPMVVPFPNSPSTLLPQQNAVPTFVRPHAVALSEESWVNFTPTGSAVRSTATGKFRVVDVPSPIWPTVLMPQQYTAPVVASAQVEAARGPVATCEK